MNELQIPVTISNNLPPVAVLSSTPDRDWFYNGENVVFDYYDSYDPDTYLTDTRWYINNVLQQSGTFTFSECFVLHGSPVGDCYELPAGQSTVAIKLGVKDVQGAWAYETITYTIREHKGRRYFVKDHLGSVRATVNRDGNVLGYDDYYPFGLAMPGRSSNSANPNDDYKFTGYELDNEAGLNLYNANARMYDPVIPWFMSIDPLHSERPGLSPYNYVQNNPLNRIDPTGMLDDVYLNSETNEVTIIETDDDYDVLYVDGEVAGGTDASAWESEASNTYSSYTNFFMENSWAISDDNWLDNFNRAERMEVKQGIFNARMAMGSQHALKYMLAAGATGAAVLSGGTSLIAASTGSIALGTASTYIGVTGMSLGASQSLMDGNTTAAGIKIATGGLIIGAYSGILTNPYLYQVEKAATTAVVNSVDAAANVAISVGENR